MDSAEVTPYGDVRGAKGMAVRAALATAEPPGTLLVAARDPGHRGATSVGVGRNRERRESVAVAGCRESAGRYSTCSVWARSGWTLTMRTCVPLLQTRAHGGHSRVA
jgi:hypothetical protein